MLEHQPISLPLMRQLLFNAQIASNACHLKKWRRLLRTAIRSAQELETVSRQLREANLRAQFKEAVATAPGFAPEVVFGDQVVFTADELDSLALEGTEVPEVDWSKFALSTALRPRWNFQNMRPGQVWVSTTSGSDGQPFNLVFKIKKVDQDRVFWDALHASERPTGLLGVFNRDGFYDRSSTMVLDEHGHWEPGFSAKGAEPGFSANFTRRLPISERDNTPNIRVGQTWLRHSKLYSDGSRDLQVVKFVGSRMLGSKRFGTRYDYLESKILWSSKKLTHDRPIFYRVDRLAETMSRAVLLSTDDWAEPQFR